MATGLGLLRWSPAAFWATTPLEIAAAIRGLSGAATVSGPPSRGDLDALVQRFPDHASLGG